MDAPACSRDIRCDCHRCKISGLLDPSIILSSSYNTRLRLFPKLTVLPLSSLFLMFDNQDIYDI